MQTIKIVSRSPYEVLVGMDDDATVEITHSVEGVVMRFLAFLEGASGVRGVFVGTEDGEELQVSGSVRDSAWTSLRCAAIARDLGVAGSIAGLGGFRAAAVRSSETSRLLTQNVQSIALIDLDMTRGTADIEKQLQDNEWESADIDASLAPASSSDHETLPPRAVAHGASNAVVERSEEAPAPIPAPVPAPPRPYQGLQAIAGRPVPRPNSSASAPGPRPSAPSLGPLAPRAARPPLPPTRVQAVAPITIESSNEAERSGTLHVPNESSRREETTNPGSALLTGSLATFALPDLLEFLRVGQRTGTLVCASEAGVGAIHLKRGRITGAASPGVPSIGEWLVQRGALSQEKLHEALRHHTQAGATTQLGATLVKHNLVLRETLQEALVFHIGAVLRKLMTWETGAFTFEPASSESAVGADIEIEPQAVLLNIFKELDDAQRA